MPFIAPKTDNPAKIKVIGIGGGGQNAVNTMVRLDESRGVEFIAMNTDLQALGSCDAPVKLQLGPQRTHGLGSGADPQIGQEAALESTEDIRKMLEGSDMVFITAGLGGGTGTGASPMVAQLAKEMGILTVGVVTRPFDFEGKRRMTQADEGIKDLKGRVDALIVIPNQKLLEVIEEKTSMQDAFKIVDKVVGNAVKGISDLINSSGLVNVDFADVKAVMNNAGSALMGIGRANGENRAEKAANMAINSPLLGIDIKGSTGILMNIVGDSSLTMHEVNKAAKIVSECASENANIIFGASIDPSIEGIQITVIATGFDTEYKSLVVPQINSAISDKDIIHQIETRFDTIKNEKEKQNPSNDDEPIIVIEEIELIHEEVEEVPNKSDSGTFDFGELDRNSDDELKDLRKAVAEMEGENKETKTPEKHKDSENNDKGHSSFFGFMRSRDN